MVLGKIAKVTLARQTWLNPCIREAKYAPGTIQKSQLVQIRRPLSYPDCSNHGIHIFPNWQAITISAD